jgi:hypothetical protein
MAIKKSSKHRVVSVNMEGVESGGQVVEDGIYPVIIHEIEEKESSSGNPMLLVKWKITGKKGKGALLWDNLSLQPQALWRLKGMLEALGEDVPDSMLDLDLDDLVGKEARVQVENEKYEGKDRPRVTAYASLEDKGDDEEDEEEAEEEDETEEEDEDEKPAKKGKTSLKGKSTSDDSDEGEDEEEEEDEKPKKKIVFVKGSKVKFKDDKGKSVKGKVSKVSGDVVIVTDSDGDDWELSADDLELQ